MKNTNIKQNAIALRQKATELLKDKQIKKSTEFSESDSLKLIHELEVHQIELELINEELKLVNEKSELIAKKYTDLYDFATSGYFTLSKEGNITELNLQGAKILNKERSNLIDSNFNCFVSNETKPVFIQFLEKLFSSDNKETCDVTIITNSLTKTFVNISGIVSENGENCFITIVDITDHEKLLETYNFLLRCGLPGSGEDFFESLTEYLASHLEMDYVCIDRLEGDGLNAQTIAVFNNGVIDPNVSYALKDTPCGEVVGKTICCFPENVCKLFPYDEALQDLKAVSYIGTTLWSFDGIPIGLIAVIGQRPLKNVSFAETILKLVAVRAAAELERKQSVLELIKAKEKAEESDRLKSAFLANMSHEIRTPMNGILGFADLLKTPNLKGEKQQEYITIIEDSGKRMLNIINDIINISKIESGLTEVIFSQTNINEQIQYVYSFFKPEIAKKGLQFKCNTSLPAHEAIINTDREKVSAILINLVKNAIKFTHQGFIEIGYEKKQENILFYVKDSGVGIHNEQLELVFERFRQGSESLSRNYEGSGLGLSISKAYVELLGGNIGVESEKGKGSTFYFTIPINMEQKIDFVSEKIAKDAIVGKIINDLKILIVEDDLISEKLTRINVAIFSKNIISAKNGVEAIQICKDISDIDLVLMDIKIPELNGYEATKQIRQFNKDVIIIAQTAYALEGEKEKAIEAGCNDYISKPYNQASFNGLMKKYFTE